MSSESELLQEVIKLLGEVKSEQRRQSEMFENATQESRSWFQRLRGEQVVLQGEMRKLSGDIDRLNGNVIVVGAIVEELERSERRTYQRIERMEQAMDGLAQLGKTTFDQNESILKLLTGASGAERPTSKRGSRSSQS